mmetsp:Transcript_4764/g.12236  ORF Transcript_4764/g.12236 Transcript_4764/m.12236 type:complete len:149 (-) Transcript_4764:235-681(-)
MWNSLRSRDDNQECKLASKDGSDGSDPTDVESMETFDEFDSVVNDFGDTRRKSFFLEDDPKKESHGSMTFEGHCYPVTIPSVPKNEKETPENNDSEERKIVSNFLLRRRCKMFRGLLIFALAICAIGFFWMTLRNRTMKEVVLGATGD